MFRQLSRLAQAQAKSLICAVSEAGPQQLQHQAQDLLLQRLVHTAAWQQQQLCSAGSGWQQLLRADQQAVFRRSRCWQQLRGIKTAADHARERNRKGIVDGGLYLVSCSSGD
jgi:hypothetical protein